LIASFTALSPELWRGTVLGTTLVLVGGIVASVTGLWIVRVDFHELSKLLSRNEGWLFTIPLALVSSDVCLTMIGLSTTTSVMELNPFVANAVQAGRAAIVAFIVSYMALSEGLALATIPLGRFLFSQKNSMRFVPYSLVCAAASFGSFSNIALLTGLRYAWTAALVGITGAAFLGALTYLYFRSCSEYY